MTTERRIVNIVFQGVVTDDAIVTALADDYVDLDERYGFHRLGIDDDLILHLHNPTTEMLFDELWDMLQDDMLGFVIMVESLDPSSFRSTRSLLEMFHAHAPVPYVVAVSSQDHPDEWDAESVRIALRIPDNVQVLPCVVNSIESIKQVVLTLLYEVLAEFEDES